MPDRLPSRLQRVRKAGVGFLGPDGEPWTGAKPVCVSRPSRFGNPFRWEAAMAVGYGGGRGAARQAFEDWLNDLWPYQHAYVEERATLRAHLADLRGQPLACWCPLGSHCHADVLLVLANKEAAHG